MWTYLKMFKEKDAKWKEISRDKWLAVFHSAYRGEPEPNIEYNTPFSLLRMAPAGGIITKPTTMLIGRI